MLKGVLSFFAGALANFLAAVIADWRRDTTNRALGETKASATLQMTVAEIADAQAEINAADRAGADDVARRLRERLAAGGGKH